MNAYGLPLLIEAGAIGVALGLALVVWRITDRQASLNHRVVDVLDRNARALSKLTAVIDHQTKETERVYQLLLRVLGNPEEVNRESADVGNADCVGGVCRSGPVPDLEG